MIIPIVNMINNDIYDINVNNRYILLNKKKIYDINYILLTSSNKKYFLKFFDIYEKLICSTQVSLDTYIEYGNEALIINTYN